MTVNARMLTDMTASTTFVSVIAAVLSMAPNKIVGAMNPDVWTYTLYYFAGCDLGARSRSDGTATVAEHKRRATEACIYVSRVDMAGPRPVACAD